MYAMLLLRDLPRYESLLQRAQRYPQVDPRAVEACLVLLRTATDVLQAIERLLQRLKMSQGKFTVLMVLSRDTDSAMNPSELAERCGVTRATMTGLLEGLEREKMIHRQGDRADRRRNVVRLTPAAKEFLDGMLPDYFTRIHGLMVDLSEADKQHLTGLLQKIGRRIPELVR
jgi:DNA-binding MarR family transcriptional regulator